MQQLLKITQPQCEFEMISEMDALTDLMVSESVPAFSKPLFSYMISMFDKTMMRFSQILIVHQHNRLN